VVEVFEVVFCGGGLGNVGADLPDDKDEVR
jgi:hypothetical protein